MMFRWGFCETFLSWREDLRVVNGIEVLTRVCVLSAVMLLGGCGSPEEKAAGYLDKAQALFEEGRVEEAKLELRNSLQIAPKNARARYLFALINEREEDYAKVLGNLLMAVETDPEFVDARVKLGYYYSIGQQADKAMEQAESAMQLAPDNAAVRLLNARAIYLSGDADGALEQTRIALSIDPMQRGAITFAAALHTSAGRIDEALAVIEEGIETTAGDAADVEALRLAKVRILQQAGDIDSVERELKQLSEDFPEASTYPLALAQLYAGQERAEEAEKQIEQLIARDPDNAVWRIQLAGLLLTLNNSDDAESSLKEAIAGNPESEVLRLALAGFYEAENRSDDALAVYAKIAQANPRTAEGLAARNRLAVLNLAVDEAIAREIVGEILTDVPNNVDALLFRAAFSVQDNQMDQAIADLRSVRARQPDSERGLLMLARAYLLNGDVELAGDVYRRLLERNPTNRAARNELASLIGNQGDADQAALLLRETLKMAPGDVGASRNLVKAMMIQQDFEGAAREARRMVDLGESSGSADFQLGLAMQAQNEDEQAIAAYKDALQKNPNAEEPLNNLIRLLVETGRTEEAERFLETHAEVNPESTLTQLLLGELYRSDGRTDQARAVFTALIERQPDVVGAYIGLAAILASEPDEQATILAQGLKNNPGNSQLGLVLGSAYKQREDYERAIEVYEGVVQVNGGSDIIVNNLALLLLDFRTDETSHSRALELASRFETSATHPFNLGVLGWAYYRNGQSVRAARYLERAVAEAGDNPKLRYFLGMAYLRNGDATGARQELEKAVNVADAAGGWFEGYDEAVVELKALQADDS